MPRTVIVLNAPTLKVAKTQAGLTSGQSVECQVTSARVTASPNYQTIPATGCAGASQSPGLTSFALDLAWLDDWGTPAPGGLSQFAWDNDGQEVWFELTLSADNEQTVTGNALCAAGGIGGTFGDGSAANSTATWPCPNKPTIAPATTTLEAAAA